MYMGHIKRGISDRSVQSGPSVPCGCLLWDHDAKEAALLDNLPAYNETTMQKKRSISRMHKMG